MRKWLVLLLLPLMASCPGKQSMESVLDLYNSESVPYIQVDKLAEGTEYILLDTRESAEFQVSHLDNAQWVGYDQFDIEEFLKKYPNKDEALVVYCSIGVRSEDIGEQLQDAGYTNVKNLYGGIFEWKNKGYPVVDTLKEKTEKVHAYSKYWGRLLTNAEKVYSP
ncbi:rhodanese-like domain-containing protein [Lentiprolixibacter aurantiacus]|uniref:Rhodanese-like domain-containing protein n=1 Tax=Lentiprolixibacter aurantiacus TaxID=2993939 RepID=A0AAE3MJQ9_9FLAO|nr:rhodanese-like domain-containing protein [Lentiprolixibacter aurantiacus]MCX2718134.1 rhodanese-like domain-containing protein [Lentiprolixibacter aurantiacus]